MINLPIKRLRNGMITSQSIYNSRGASYLTKGMSLNEHYIDRLERIGIEEVNVTSLDPGLRLPPPDDIVQEKTRITAIHRVYDVFQTVEESGIFSLDKLQDVSETILLDLIAQRRNLVQLTDIRVHDTYTFAHSVNVAILAAMLGLLCHYSKRNLLDLTLGALLHDMGKIVIPTEILNKPGRLDQNEWDLIRMHPEIGRQRLRNLNISSATMLATIALQHHEHLDGTGYPNHLAGDQIHRFARIVAIADVYDALTSDRPYKKAYNPAVAYRIMTACSDGHFDEELLKLFFDNVALYPVGTIMKTKLGYGIVKQIEFGRTFTPILCVFATRNAVVMPKPFHVDLGQCPSDIVENILSDNELYHFIHQINIDPAIYLSV